MIAITNNNVKGNAGSHGPHSLHWSWELNIIGQILSASLFRFPHRLHIASHMLTKAKNACVAEAYQKYFSLWVNLAKSVHTTDEEAKDIVHTVIASILENPSTEFESVTHVRNYVAKGVLNRSIQARQRGGRTGAWTEIAELRHAVEAKEPGIDEERRMRAFREALLGLPKRDFEIIKMRFFTGLQFKEISKMLHRPVSTLKSREEAAIKRIREFVRKRGF